MITRLEQVWEESSTQERQAAMDAAQHLLENLVHYAPMSRKGRYFTEDRQMLAAELLAWKKEGAEHMEAKIVTTERKLNGWPDGPKGTT